MNKTTKTKKNIKGKIVGKNSKDTFVVLVERYVKHPRYKKYLTMRKKFAVHSKRADLSIGDRVEIRETRPISKTKKFEIV